MKLSPIDVCVNHFNQIGRFLRVFQPVLAKMRFAVLWHGFSALWMNLAHWGPDGCFWQQLIESTERSCYFFGSLKDHHGRRQSAIFNYLSEEDQ